MATMNLVLLPSSPSKPHYHAPLTMSSSQDDLPSPSALIRNNRKLKMPTKRMSTTPTKLSPDAEKPSKDDIWDVPDDELPAKPVEPPAKKPRRRPKKEVATVSEVTRVGAEPPKRRGRPKKAVTEGDDVAAPKEKAVRKSRTKKADEDGQTKITKGRVTKACTSSTTFKKTYTVSSHFPAAQGDSIDIENIPEKPDLELTTAVERRVNGTPAKESGSYPCQLEESVVDEQMQDTSIAVQGFSKLMDSYSYTQKERSESTSTTDTNPAQKRKLIELVKTGNSAITSKAKSKAVPKKARTITNKATAQYATAIEEEEESAPILQYFTREDSGVDPSGAPRAKVTRLFKKPGKGKKAAEPPTALLPPRAALEHAKRQEFVFGTSSQLAREEDPSFLRDLQQAMQLSNQYDVDDPFAEPLPSISSNNPGRPNLLEAASMIEEEGAKDIEILDLTRSSQVDSHFTKEATPPATAEAETSAHLELTAESDGEWILLDETPLPAPPSKSAPAISRAASPSPPIRAPASHPPSAQVPDPVPVESDTVKPATQATAKAKRPANPAGQCPDYDSYSTTDLTKEIAKYKFKPIKRREDMVSLLRKCWEGKQKQAQGVLSAIPKPVEAPPPSSQPPATAPLPVIEAVEALPRKRGRPKKGEPTTASMRKLDSKQLSSTKPIPTAQPASAPALSTPKRGRGRPRKVLPIAEDISDTEGPTPSPPRIRASKVQPLEIVPEPDSDAEATLIPLSPSSQERELFTAISKAITTQPRSTDAKIYLSWYEKILLYDPILLEDLTKWLNEEGLGRVGYDGEVMPAQVKSWCLGKSICCLFKESRRNRGVDGVKKIGRE